MTSIFKEYSFVVISMLGAIVFFCLLAWMLRYKNERSIVRMMDSNLQYSTTNIEAQYGRDSLDQSLSQIVGNVPYIQVSDSKSYHIEDTYEKKDLGEIDAEGNPVEVVPPIQYLTRDFIMLGVTVDNASLDDIEITVIDYTPALALPETTDKNSISGKTYTEQVIAVDKFGNRKQGSDFNGYKGTDRLAYEQRQVVDSTTLAADEYNQYYGNVYFNKNGTWYKDTGNGEYDDSDTVVTDTGIPFSTDVPHKFKVIYRVTGATSAKESRALKSEVTKLFVAKPREQKDRSVAIYQEIYEKKTEENAGVPDNTNPDNVVAPLSAVPNYVGMTSDDVINDAIQDRLNRVQDWQEEEQERQQENTNTGEGEHSSTPPQSTETPSSGETTPSEPTEGGESTEPTEPVVPSETPSSSEESVPSGD